MDDMDINEQIQLAAEDKLRMITVELDNGIPIASSVKHYYTEKGKPKITPQQQSALQEAWTLRVLAKRDLNDNKDNNKVTALKNNYFSAIDNYKRLYRAIYGE